MLSLPLRNVLLLTAIVSVGCGSEKTKSPSSDPSAVDDDAVEDDEDKAPSNTTRDASAPRIDAGPAQRMDAGPTSPKDGGVPAADAGGGSVVVSGPFAGEGTPWLDTTPRATCSEGDKADGTIGALSGDFRCNLTVKGQVEAPHFLSLAWLNDCAYVNGADGTSVIHVSPEGKPTVTTMLTEVGFRSNWESMKANPESKLLAGYESNGATLTVYDLSADCKAPVLQSSTQLGSGLGSIGHAGSFSPDGTIYYASSMYTAAIFAIDLALPKKPVVITSMFDKSAHDLFIGKSGTRGYFAYPNLTTFNVGSLAIMDLTDVQKRTPGAKGKLIKELQWEDGNISQYPLAIHYGGKDYLVITDELGSGNCDNPKKPQWGYARIFDIQDEQNPKLVSVIKTEAQDPKNCKAAGEAAGGTSGFGLGTHYCNVDRLDDPRVLACGNWDAGLRVYDIRNPWQPKEVAYFDTPAGNLPGLARILPDKREIWIATVPSTFYVLKMTPGSALDRIFAE